MIDFKDFDQKIWKIDMKNYKHTEISITIKLQLNNLMSITILTLFETGRAKIPTFVFFFKYPQNEKRYDFALLWLLVIIYSERSCQISLENFDWLTIYCDFVRGVPKNSKNFFFILNQQCLQNISSIHYVKEVNMINVLG